jgi:hypothetical protein
MSKLAAVRPPGERLASDALDSQQDFFADVASDLDQAVCTEQPLPTESQAQSDLKPRDASPASPEPSAGPGAPPELQSEGGVNSEPQPASSAGIVDYDALVQMQKDSAQHTTFGQRARASLVVAFGAVAAVSLLVGAVALVLERGFTRPQAVEWEHPQTQRRRKQAEVESRRKRQADELWRRAYALPSTTQDQAANSASSGDVAPTTPGAASPGGQTVRSPTGGNAATERPHRLASGAPVLGERQARRPGASSPSSDEEPGGVLDLYGLYAKAEREKIRVGTARPSTAGPAGLPSKQIPVDGIRLQARLIEDAANDVAGAEIIAVLIEDASLGQHRLPRGTEIHGRVTGATRTHRITAEFTLLRDKQKRGPPIHFQGRARGQDGRVGIPGKQILGKEAAESVGVAAASEGLRSLVRATGGLAGEVIDDTARAGAEKGAEKAQRLDQDAIVVMAKANTAFEVYVHSVRR